MNLIDCLLMLLLNTAVCICLPRLLTLLRSNPTRSNWGFSGEGSDRTPKSFPEFSKPTGYPELGTIPVQSQTSSPAL